MARCAPRASFPSSSRKSAIRPAGVPGDRRLKLVSQTVDRQPRRDRRARHPRLQGDGHLHRGGVFRGRPRRSARVAGGRERLHRPASAARSYLNMPAILSAAALTGAQAIHPGYGCFRKTRALPSLCAQCHIKFIGPSAEVIRRMGDKDEARRTMRAAGVPVVPAATWWKMSNSCAPRRKRSAIRFDQGPLRRGGRGIRRVDGPEELEHGLPLRHRRRPKAPLATARCIWKSCWKTSSTSKCSSCAMRTATSSPWRARMLHAAQAPEAHRESPSPAVDEALRIKMLAAATRAAKAVNYEAWARWSSC